MKKGYLGSVAFFALMLLLLPLLSCKEPTGEHTHAYTEQRATVEYLSKQADCTTPASYYFSCSCGEKGTDTFTQGEANGHCFNMKLSTNDYIVSNANCEHGMLYCYSCFYCGARGEETFEIGLPLPHHFTLEKTDASHLCREASCTSPALYYYSCVCGLKSHKTFAVGEALAHDFSCKVISDATLRSASTCQAAAEYYYSCACGMLGEESFSHGEVYYHVYVNSVCIFCKKDSPFGGDGLSTPILPFVYEIAPRLEDEQE